MKTTGALVTSAFIWRLCRKRQKNCEIFANALHPSNEPFPWLSHDGVEHLEHVLVDCVDNELRSYFKETAF
jgi:hypothetical protein